AGRGITHSERTDPAKRAGGPALHGLQLWVALPDEHEEVAPSFVHHPAHTLPERQRDGTTLRVLAGSAFAMTSPVTTLSPLFYAEATLEAGASFTLPDEYAERALYLVSGAIHLAGERIDTPQMVVLERGAASIRAETGARVMFLGGEPIGERHIWWNFVSSRKERIEEAKADWKAGRFAAIPGDDQEFIPLPE
ncbi:MAG TPA: pirin-like C-terminal cupin domain-containing protein, partial [Kofleriaceae bacterium]|nr:pirin-like C-terminal cupin domain-containing protein [Kofleriaceae bacterium]